MKKVFHSRRAISVSFRLLFFQPLKFQPRWTDSDKLSLAFLQEAEMFHLLQNLRYALITRSQCCVKFHEAQAKHETKL